MTDNKNDSRPNVIIILATTWAMAMYRCTAIR